jgi:phage portal protein BeeE
MEVEFNFDALLRADLKSRTEAYRIGITSGIITPNEARQMEHLQSLPGGDKLFMQGAMMPVENLGADPITEVSQNANETP